MPIRATQSPPPSVRRRVLEEGGDHDPDGLVTLCAAHHKALHDGRIVIEGRPSERLAFFHADGTPYGGAASPDVIELKTKAFSALRHMGFKETEVRRALDVTSSHVGNVTLESVVKQALLVLT